MSEKTSENTVFVGSKPFMTYVTSVVMQFTSQNRREVIIKARGKFITKAVDIAEVVRRKFLREHNIFVKEIKIGSEEFESKEGKKVSVSIIEISLARQQLSEAAFP